MASSRINPYYDIATSVASLKISDCSTFDSAVYEVVVENNVGQDRSSAKVLVHPVPVVQSASLLPQHHVLPKPEKKRAPSASERLEPPRIIVPLREVSVVEGAMATLVCKIDGKPKPSVRWLKDGRPINESNRIM